MCYGKVIAVDSRREEDDFIRTDMNREWRRNRIREQTKMYKDIIYSSYMKMAWLLRQDFKSLSIMNSNGILELRP